MTAADAQSSFTQRLQQSNQGEGKVTVKQSKEIDDLVNGSSTGTPSTPTANRKQQEKEKTNDQAVTTKEEKPLKALSERQDSTDVSDSTVDNHKKVMKGYKINGYRVQVFAGGNSRNDRIKSVTRSSHFSLVNLFMCISTPHDGYAVWATTAVMKKPTRYLTASRILAISRPLSLREKSPYNINEPRHRHTDSRQPLLP